MTIEIAGARYKQQLSAHPDLFWQVADRKDRGQSVCGQLCGHTPRKTRAALKGPNGKNIGKYKKSTQFGFVAFLGGAWSVQITPKGCGNNLPTLSEI